MSYYLWIEDNKINGGSTLLQKEVFTDNRFQVEVSEEVHNSYIKDNLKYVWNGTEIILNPNYEEDKKTARHNYAMELSMTPLDFLKAIEPYGITYEMIKQLMADNPQVERELRFCQNVYRKHPMIIQFAEQFGITSEQLDELFIAANGEPD